MIFLKKLRFIPVALLLVLVCFSCDNDYNTIGGELLGSRFDSLPRYDAMVRAYNVNLGPVQTNGLPANLVGVYHDPVNGQQTASVLAQLQLPTINPTFGGNPVVDSVTLDLPYYSTQIDKDENNDPVYRLDSIFGSGAFQLKVSRSNFFLNDYDPEDDFQSRQKYYSDLGPIFEDNLAGTLYENNQFEPSANIVSYYGLNKEGVQDTLKVAPRLRVKLSKEVFQQVILDQEGNTVLSNNNNFKDYFRGIYVQAAASGSMGSMALLNFAHKDAGVTIYYTSTVIDTNDADADGDRTEEIEIPQTYKLSIGNTVNTFKEELPAEIQQSIAESDSVFGAKNLYLKGGEGSMAVIELFEDEAELAELRANNWLINEASLIFYVNQDIVDGGKAEPLRLYLYNLKTNDRLIDYVIDPTSGQTTPAASSVLIHSGILEMDEDENGIRYKMRITRTVDQLLSQDSTSLKLGLVVTQNIKIVSNAALKTPIGKIDRVPTASVITPKGTVLYGNLADDPAKRLKLQIYYTELNN